jgi:hypothetical protein
MDFTLEESIAEKVLQDDQILEMVLLLVAVMERKAKMPVQITLEVQTTDNIVSKTFKREG